MNVLIENILENPLEGLPFENDYSILLFDCFSFNRIRISCILLYFLLSSYSKSLNYFFNIKRYEHAIQSRHCQFIRKNKNKRMQQGILPGFTLVLI